MPSRPVSTTAALVVAAGLFLGNNVPGAQAHATVSVRAAALGGTSKVDVDGDGRADSVKLSRKSSSVVAVTVKTRKRTASATVKADDSCDRVFYGAGRLDGAKGSELIIRTWCEDGEGLKVLTWRKGKLVSEAAPKQRALSGKYFRNWDRSEEEISGFRFFTTSGKRYVDATYAHLGEDDSDPDFGKGYTVRSVWRSGSWAVVKSSKVKLTYDDADRYNGFHGVTLVTK